MLNGGAARSAMQRTQCSDGGGKIAVRPAPPGKLARTARVAGSGPTKTQGATHYYSAALSALADFIFFFFSPTQAALASLTAPAIQTLTWVHGATIMTVWIWGWCIAASWEIFSPGRWGGYPVAKFFLVILQERLHHQQPSAIIHSSGGCWFPKANALACRTSSHLDPPHLGPGSQ